MIKKDCRISMIGMQKKSSHQANLENQGSDNVQRVGI